MAVGRNLNVVNNVSTARRGGGPALLAHVKTNPVESRLAGALLPTALVVPSDNNTSSSSTSLLGRSFSTSLVRSFHAVV